MTNPTPHGQVPEALRLAALLDAEKWTGSMTLVSYARSCVAELRRLHAENEALRTQQPAPAGAESKPHGWLYDWTHSSATGKPDTTYTGFTKDEAHARKHDNCTAVFTTPQPAPATQQAWWTNADSDAARLALELECLLMDTKDTAVVSKWWQSANEALELHRARLQEAQPSPTAQAAESVPAREHDLQDVRCECCGYMTYHREHMGCIRAARAPSDSVLEDAADPLQGAANWLAEAHGQFSPVVLSGCLMIGYNRAKRLHDAALAARKQGANHD